MMQQPLQGQAVAPGTEPHHHTDAQTHANRFKVWDFPNSIALRWSTIPHFSYSMTENLTNYEHASSDNLLLGSLIVRPLVCVRSGSRPPSVT